MINNVYEKLKQIGWYHNRHIEVQIFENDVLKNPLDFIKEFGKLYYVNNSKIYFDFINEYRIIFMDNMKIVPILNVFNAIFGKIIIAMNEQGEIFIYNRNIKLADNKEEFFIKIFKNDFNIKPEIDVRTLKELKKSGWSINRKIDISDMYSYLKENNIELFETAYLFFENFYNLSGFTWGDDGMQWRILNEFDLIDRQHFFKPHILDNIIELQYLPICTLDDGMITYYITENEKIYNEMGTLIGNNIIEGINSILRS